MATQARCSRCNRLLKVSQGTWRDDTDGNECPDGGEHKVTLVSWKD